MADILDQNNSTGDVDADLDLYGETDTLDPQFTEQDVLGNDDDDDDDDDHRNQHHHDKGLLTTHENGSNGEDAMAIKSDQLDHDDEQQHEHEEDEDESDLYDAAIEPSSDAASSKSNEMLGNSAGTLTASSSSLDRGGRRFCCYVGNMTWWTTDADLQDAIYASGIGDLIDIKFYENRNNGQSKGFALAVFSSESAVRQCIDKLPQKQLHGQPLVVLPYTKSSLAKFEEATRRPGQDKKPDATGVGGVGVKKDGDKAVVNFGTIRIGQAPIALRAAQQQTLGRQPPSITSLVLSAGQQPQRVQPVPLQSLAPPRPLSLIANVVQQQQQQQQQQLQPPPGAGIPQSMMMMNRPPPVYSMQPLMHQPMLQRHVLPPPQQQHAAPPGFPPPGAHINPQVYPGFMPNLGPPLGMYQQPHPHHHLGGDAPLSEAEFEEIMNRNRTVSSSAISRAVTDAAAGDFASAIETLVTAISLIRQSRVANDDRCKVLITSLQDTLHGIEARSYARNSGRTKDRHSRDRGSRSPDLRSSRKRHRRGSSRSRSRSRDRGGGGSSSYDYSPRHSSSSRRN